MSNVDDGPYQVGYGRPPLTTRFQPGQSGNPQGRPKGSRNLITYFLKEFGALVPITQNGKHKRVPMPAAVAKRICNQALAGQFKFVMMFWNMLLMFERNEQPSPEAKKQMKDSWSADELQKMSAVELAALYRATIAECETK